MVLVGASCGARTTDSKLVANPSDGGKLNPESAATLLSLFMPGLFT